MLYNIRANSIYTLYIPYSEVLKRVLAITYNEKYYFGKERIYYEKRVDIVYIEAKTRDVGHLAYGDMGRKNPRPYKPINKATYIELVLQDLLIGSLLARGPKGPNNRSLELGAKKGHNNNKGIYR